METKKINAEEDYITTPISVLSYISELENQTASQQQTIERLREGMQNFLKWHEKYPPKRIYNHGTAIKIESELTKLMEEAEQLFNTTEPIDR